MCEYGFVENQDYILVSQKCLTNNPKNPYTTITNHAIKLDMAKVDAQKRTRTYGNQDYILVVQKRTINNPKKQTEGRLI